VAVDGTWSGALDMVSQRKEVGHLTETALAAQSVEERDAERAEIEPTRANARVPLAVAQGVIEVEPVDEAEHPVDDGPPE
jgi:hypothetical protein